MQPPVATGTSDENRPGLLTRAYRTATPGYASHEDREMDSLGWTMFLLVVVLFIPFLPLLIAVWLVTKVLDAVAGRGGAEE
ncbi:DUF7535 family protein [Halopelagius longus]|uniref:Uncharacterized protein n=1 Tax=Halopelagius longus TaxID=1236180 RepID=A0A1H1DUC3_9EURY|nr:hypothetical protein [Halopelagius longus]RDI71474.1 hypothetical protein DWB78_06935 [Halopelagius longus]SDQ80152.1 hypothetical protein SAMN05216278_2590 [Halopelagius longus]